MLEFINMSVYFWSRCSIHGRFSFHLTDLVKHHQHSRLIYYITVIYRFVSISQADFIHVQICIENRRLVIHSLSSSCLDLHHIHHIDLGIFSFSLSLFLSLLLLLDHIISNLYARSLNNNGGERRQLEIRGIHVFFTWHSKTVHRSSTRIRMSISLATVLSIWS